MDSVTQITLGAAVGYATLGRKIGWRAALWGGICGTLPDLDNFIPYDDAVAMVTYHRSFSRTYRPDAVNGLVLSSLYLAWMLAAKLHVEEQALDSLRQQDIQYTRLLSTPTPFNSLLWRFVAMDKQGYYEGYYSVLDKSNNIQWTHYRDDKSLLQGINGYWSVQRLRWFTHGFYSVLREGKDIVITDLCMDMEPSYPFRYKVAVFANPHPRPAGSTLVPSEWREERVR